MPLTQRSHDRTLSPQGEVSKKEFRRGVRAVGIVATTVEINQLFERIDFDNDGTVTLEELQRELDMIHPTLKNPEVGVSVAPSDAHTADGSSEGGLASRTPVIAAKAAGISTSDIRGYIAGQTIPVTQSQGPPTRGKGKQATVKTATLAVREDYRAVAELDLDRGRIWAFKVFTLFPLLKYLSQLDFVFRVVFPIAYVINLMIYMSEVNFGRDQIALLETSPCYLANIQNPTCGRAS